jgi:hypothetical protein
VIALSSREGKLGTKYSGSAPKEDADDGEHSTLKFALDGLEVDETELNALLAEPHAWRSLYDTSGPVTRPYLKCLAALELKDAVKSAYVAIQWPSGCKGLIFADAKLKKLKLELGDEGITKLSCQVEVEAVLDKTLLELLDRLGQTIMVEIRAEQHLAQQDLPLVNKFGVDEQPDAPPARHASKRRLN